MPKSEAEIRDWCRAFLARLLERPVDEIPSGETFAALGLDSARSPYFVLELEEFAGVQLEVESVGDHPTIDALARHVTEVARGAGA